MLSQFADLFAGESLQPGSMVARGNTGPGDAPRGLYRCAGDDDWCVVDIRGQADWVRLCDVMGRPELVARYRDAGARVEHRDQVDEIVQAWIGALPAREAMVRLQAAGVPAGMMLRVEDLPSDEHLVARRLFDLLDQPQIASPLTVERGPAHFTGLADPPQRPAPRIGEHTRQICTMLLGMSDRQVDDLLAAHVLEGPLEETTPASPAGADDRAAAAVTAEREERA
jgi:crotonobetainyl-CoA:carnitine CoA-transferase CaiB-like acyl-CoA transferase